MKDGPRREYIIMDVNKNKVVMRVLEHKLHLVLNHDFETVLAERPIVSQEEPAVPEG